MNDKSKLIAGIGAAVCAALSVFLFLNKENISIRPWRVSNTLSMIGDANGNGERIAVVANSTESVFVLNNAGELLYRVDAGANFTSVQFVDIDEENNLYIYDRRFGGVKEQNTERVVKFSPSGKFLDELYSYQYINEDFIYLKGKIAGIAVSEGLLYVVRLEHEGFYLEWTSVNQRAEAHQLAFFSYPNAFRDLAYCGIDIEKKRVVFTTKSGVILRYSFSGSLLTKTSARDDSFPYMTVQDEKNDFIYTDIINNVIAKTDAISGESSNIFSPPGGCYYHIAYKNGTIYASNNEENVLVMQNGEPRTIDSYTYSKYATMFRIVLFVLCILDIAAFLMFLIATARLLRKKKLGGNFKLILLVTLCIVLGAGISSVLIVNEMNRQYYQNLGNSLENMLKIIANSIDLTVIRSVNSPARFDDADFKKFEENIRYIFTQLEFEGKQVYFTIWVEQNGIIYSMFDLDYSTGTFYPYDEYEDSFLQKAYESGQFAIENIHTNSGRWFDNNGPVFDANGEPIAALEIGYNMQSVEKEQRDMMIQLSLIVISTIIAFLLIMIEFILILNAYKQNKNEITQKAQSSTVNPGLLKSIVSILTDAYNKNKDENRPVKFQPRMHKAILYYLAKTYNTNTTRSFHPELLRVVIFLAYVAACFDKPILPIYAEQLYIPFFGLPKEVIITLPLILQVAGSVLALLIAPSILERVGSKRIAFISSVLCLVGNLLCFAAGNIISLSIGYVFSGFSDSTLVMVLNTIIGSQKSESDVNKGFAHFNASYLAGMNVGVIFGSIIAQFLPYRSVFFFAAIVSTVLIVIVAFSIRSKLTNYLYDISYTKEEKGAKFSLIKFIFRPIVFCSLLCLLLPYVVSMNFTDYFMPLFGTENGIAESNVGQLMLLSGLFAILFGTSLCEYVSKKFSVKTIIIASLFLDVAGIFLFSLQTSVFMLIVTIVILAIVNIFAFTNIQTYYASLYQNAAVSPIKAQSVYSSIENISIAIGPIVFSYILAYDISLGMKVFAAVMAGCVLLFAITSMFSSHGKNKPVSADSTQS
ncbi:MAG: MFS transporter [Treponema sp.]|jgi:predicted MFS family arabinose efflux permease|nr:MFS transporter [Treponema sp.]